MHINEMLEMVAEFQNATDQTVNLEPSLLKTKEAILRFELMKEENEEYFEACQNKDLVETLDAVVDKMYILLGTINSHGLQNVFTESFNRVHINNLSKIDSETGKVLRNEMGKIIKPKGFKPVDLSDLINN